MIQHISFSVGQVSLYGGRPDNQIDLIKKELY